MAAKYVAPLLLFLLGPQDHLDSQKLLSPTVLWQRLIFYCFPWIRSSFWWHRFTL